MTFTPPDPPYALPDEILRSTPAEPSPYSILSQPRPIPRRPNQQLTKDGLVSGALRWDHQRCLQGVKWPNCDPADADDYPDPAEDVGFRFFPVNWTAVVGCDGGRVTPEYEQWALEDVAAMSAHQLESFLWSAGSEATVQGTRTTMPTLMTTAGVTGGAGADAVNARDGLAQVIADYLTCNQAGGKATAWIPHILGEYLISEGALIPAGGRLVTATGHNAVLGTGFDPLIGPWDSDDDAPTEGTEGEAWIAVSGPVHYDLGEPYVTADPWGDLRSGARQSRILTGTVDLRRSSKVAVIAARRATFAFDTCCVRAIKVRIPNVDAEVG